MRRQNLHNHIVLPLQVVDAVCIHPLPFVNQLHARGTIPIKRINAIGQAVKTGVKELDGDFRRRIGRRGGNLVALHLGVEDLPGNHNADQLDKQEAPDRVGDGRYPALKASLWPRIVCHVMSAPSVESV